MNRDFKGIWIPRELWLSEELTLQEKIFLVEIDSLDNEHGCFAGNSYFANFFKLTNSRVSQIINSLAKKNLIDINYIYKENSKEMDKRIIRVNKEQYSEILGSKYINGGRSKINGGSKYINDPPLENDTDNNPISNNPINNNTISKDIVTPIQKPLINSETKKNKKSKDIGTMRAMISAFTQNESIREKLLEYFNIRLKKGLQPNQWEIILADLREFAGDNASIAIDKINGAIAGGYMQIIASWEKDKKNNFNKPKFDNTAGADVKAVVNMSHKEKQEFEDNLARDEEGNLIQF